MSGPVLDKHESNESKTKGPLIIEQSEFFKKNEQVIRQGRAILDIVVVVLFAVSVALGSYINLQMAKFPFTIPFLAHIAYNKNSFGDEKMALLLGILGGLVFYYSKTLVFSGVDFAVSRVLQENEIVAVREVYGGSSKKPLKLDV